ncbi:MAG: hypothetical protein ACQEP3_00655 [Patescibacteria group bacterium]
MDLTKPSIKELQNILEKDYGVSLNEKEVNSFGVLVLKILQTISNKK